MWFPTLKVLQMFGKPFGVVFLVVCGSKRDGAMLASIGDWYSIFANQLRNLGHCPNWVLNLANTHVLTSIQTIVDIMQIAECA